MQKEGFFKTKTGDLIIAFLVIMIAFMVILAGLSENIDLLSGTGCLFIVLAMLYSPVKTHFRDWRK